jgi:hypothetical protein
MRNLEGEMSLSSPPSSTTKPFRHRHFLGSSYEREQGPSPKRRHKEPPLVAQRLLLLQEMFEGTGRGASVRMAQGLRITPHHWYNVLRGSPLSIALAHRIVLTFPGVSLDWLYLGRPEGLSCQIAEKLGYEAAHSQPGVAEQKTSQEQRRSPAIQAPQ